MEILQKVQKQSCYMTNNPNQGYISEKNKDTKLERYMYHNVHSRIIYSCQDMKTS